MKKVVKGLFSVLGVAGVAGIAYGIGKAVKKDDHWTNANMVKSFYNNMVTDEDLECLSQNALSDVSKAVETLSFFETDVFQTSFFNEAYVQERLGISYAEMCCRLKTYKGYTDATIATTSIENLCQDCLELCMDGTSDIDNIIGKAKGDLFGESDLFGNSNPFGMPLGGFSAPSGWFGNLDNGYCASMFGDSGLNNDASQGVSDTGSDDSSDDESEYDKDRVTLDEFDSNSDDSSDDEFEWEE